MNPGELTSAQLDQFQDQGYLILPAVFDAQEIAKMRTEAHAILNLIHNLRAWTIHGPDSTRAVRPLHRTIFGWSDLC